MDGLKCKEMNGMSIKMYARLASLSGCWGSSGLYEGMPEGIRIKRKRHCLEGNMEESDRVLHRRTTQTGYAHVGSHDHSHDHSNTHSHNHSMDTLTLTLALTAVPTSFHEWVATRATSIRMSSVALAWTAMRGRLRRGRRAAGMTQTSRAASPDIGFPCS